MAGCQAPQWDRQASLNAQRLTTHRPQQNHRDPANKQDAGIKGDAGQSRPEQPIDRIVADLQVCGGIQVTAHQTRAACEDRHAEVQGVSISHLYAILLQKSVLSGHFALLAL